MAMLVLFEEFLRHILFTFLPLILSPSANMHFVRLLSILIMRAYGVRIIIIIKEVRNYGKIVFMKYIVENEWWEGGSIPH